MVRNVRRRTKKERAATLRAEGWTLEATASQVGVRESQLRNWEEEGDEEYWEIFLNTHERSFLTTYAQAMAIMRQEMRSDDSLARWRAADSILRHIVAIKPASTDELREIVDFDELINDVLDEPFDEDGEER